MAEACGVSPGRITQIRQGDGCSATLALKIEAFTANVVDAGSISKDVAMSREGREAA